MDTVHNKTHIQKLKDLTNKLCDRDIGIKNSLLHIQKIVSCDYINDNDKIVQIEEIIENTEWINQKTDGMNTQN